METYLGDGLYASFDGYQIVLRVPRTAIGLVDTGDHYVALKPAVYKSLTAFAESINKKYNVKHFRS